jgi:hypothetical protein
MEKVQVSRLIATKADTRCPLSNPDMVGLRDHSGLQLLSGEDALYTLQEASVAELFTDFIYCTGV